MSSMMLHPRRTRAYSNQSFSEKDVAKNLQRGSVQSMNTFSLRRLLGSDPSNYSSSSRYSPEASNSMTQTISKDDKNGQPSSAFRGSVETMSELLLSLTLSPGNPNDQASGDANRNFAQGSDTDLPPPASKAESGSNPEQHSGAILPSAPTSIFHRSIFTKKPHPPLQNMGNKASTILRQNPFKENQIPKAAPETGKPQRRPASSPAPPTPAYLRSLNLVIPDRHSSLSPPPIPSTLLSPADAQPQTTLPPAAADSGSAVPLLQPPTTGTLCPPPPPLSLGHYSCYQFHRHMCFSPNVHNPVPCMTCGTETGQARWKCCWCCLRICELCMEELSRTDDRDLTLLMKRLAEGKVGVGRVGRPKAIMVKGRRRVDERKGDGGKEEGEVGESERMTDEG